jgi:hypothetical protein
MNTEKQEHKSSGGTESSQRINTRKFPESRSWSADWEGNALSNTHHQTDAEPPTGTDAARTEES